MYTQHPWPDQNLASLLQVATAILAAHASGLCTLQVSQHTHMRGGQKTADAHVF